LTTIRSPDLLHQLPLLLTLSSIHVNQLSRPSPDLHDMAMIFSLGLTLRASRLNRSISKSRYGKRSILLSSKTEETWYHPAQFPDHHLNPCYLCPSMGKGLLFNDLNEALSYRGFVHSAVLCFLALIISLLGATPPSQQSHVPYVPIQSPSGGFRQSPLFP